MQDQIDFKWSLRSFLDWGRQFQFVNNLVIVLLFQLGNRTLFFFFIIIKLYYYEKGNNYTYGAVHLHKLVE